MRKSLSIITLASVLSVAATSVVFANPTDILSGVTAVPRASAVNTAPTTAPTTAPATAPSSYVAPTTAPGVAPTTAPTVS